MSTEEISKIMDGFKMITRDGLHGLRRIEFKTLISDVLEINKHKSGIECLFQKVCKIWCILVECIDVMESFKCTHYTWSQIVPSIEVDHLAGQPKITEDMFLNFLLHRMTEKEVFGKMNLIPFQDQPIFKHNPYSKVINPAWLNTCMYLYMYLHVYRSN